MKTAGLRLVFHPVSQTLILIEVVNFLAILLRYNLVVLNKGGSPPLFDDIYNRLFGPTLPGEANFNEATYQLDYPGVSFMFALDNVNYSSRNSATEKEELIIALTKSPARCTSIAVYDSAFPLYSKFYSASLCGTRNVSLNSAQIDLPNGALRLVLTDKAFEIVLGSTTQQDVLAELGPPDASHTKSDLRYEIYNKLHLSPNKESGVFHNYFRYGFDILYDTLNSGPKAIKLVIHNSVPNALDFGQYKKLNWTMKGFGSSSEVYRKDSATHPAFAEEPEVERISWAWDSTNLATSESYFKDLDSESFKRRTENGEVVPFDPLNFVLIDRNSLPMVDDSDVDLVESDEGSVLEDSLSIVNSGSKERPRRKLSVQITLQSAKRGQSKLYGHDRCIWEVLSDNDAICSVTLY